MNDDDYAAVLREELEELTSELHEARAYRDKRTKLIQVLKEERQALQVQKEERYKRSQLLLRIDDLEEMHSLKKQQRNDAFNALIVATKAYNRLLIATGNRPLDEPLGGVGIKPIDEIKKKKNAEDAAAAAHSQSFSGLPLVHNNPRQHGLSGVLSNHNKSSSAFISTDPLAPSNHSNATGKSAYSSKSAISKGSNIVVNGILRKKGNATPGGNNPKTTKPTSRRKKGSQHRSSKKTSSSSSSTAPSSTTQPSSSPSAKVKIQTVDEQQEEKPHKTDSKGDMTDFLDAIGYYSPEEDDEQESKEEKASG